MSGRAFFWTKWPGPRQARFFRLALSCWAGLLLVAWAGLVLGTADSRESIIELKETYSRVAPMVSEVLALRAKEAPVVDLDPRETFDFVVHDLGLDPRLGQVREVGIGEGAPAVQASLEALDLAQLSDLLQDLRDRGGLRTISFALERRFEDPSLADVNMILAH
ncbi:MAG: hypothetical protein JW718_11675 [Desulfovibrionaceae bacterium]|nr:hypothetical protein [Desulfovibrionaceae bacterium]